MLPGYGYRLSGAQRYPACQDRWASPALTLHEGIIGDRLDRAHRHARRVGLAGEWRGSSTPAGAGAARSTVKPTVPAEYGLRFAPFQRWQHAEPDARGAKPELVVGDQLIALPDATNPQGDHSFILAGHGRVDRGAAVDTKCLLALVTAIGGLDVDLGCAAQQPKAAAQRRHDGAESGPRKRLTVRAVANDHRGGIDLGLEPNAATVAGSIDVHVTLRGKPRASRPAVAAPVLPACTR